MDYFITLIELISENWDLIKGHPWLFIIFAVTISAITVICVRGFYAIKDKNIPERKELMDEVKKLKEKNDLLEDKIRDLTTTERMLRIDDSEVNRESIGKKIKDALD